MWQRCVFSLQWKSHWRLLATLLFLLISLLTNLIYGGKKRIHFHVCPNFTLGMWIQLNKVGQVRGMQLKWNSALFSCTISVCVRQRCITNHSHQPQTGIWFRNGSRGLWGLSLHSPAPPHDLQFLVFHTCTKLVVPMWCPTKLMDS